MAIHTGLALFAGGGGLELGLSLAIGTDYRTVAYVEREVTSAAVLAANMERPESGLDKAPIWDDVGTFTGDVVSPFVDKIDILSAGFPCQPWSVAGKRKGTADDRWLWPLIFRLVREIRPRSIFLENVSGLLHGGIEHVLGDLASGGFSAEWGSFRASDVGAPHRRERVFILAHSNSVGHQRKVERRLSAIPGNRHSNSSRELAHGTSLISERVERERATGRESEKKIRNRSRNMGDSDQQRFQGSNDYRPTSRRIQSSPVERCRELADSDGAGLRESDNPAEGRPPEQPDSRGGELADADRFRPGDRESEIKPNETRLNALDNLAGNDGELAYSSSPGLQRGLLGRGTNEERRKESDGRAATGNESLVDTISQRGRGWDTGGEYAEHAFPPGPAASAEWRDILSRRPDLAPAVKSSVRGMDDGVARGLARNDQLRILGNGVVPQQAALAYRVLAERLE